MTRNRSSGNWGKSPGKSKEATPRTMGLFRELETVEAAQDILDRRCARVVFLGNKPLHRAILDMQSVGVGELAEGGSPLLSLE